MKLNFLEMLRAWVEVKVLLELLPHQDKAAENTEKMFRQMLKDQHQVDDLLFKKDMSHYLVSVSREDNWTEHTFTTEEAYRLYDQLKKDERYLS